MDIWTDADEIELAALIHKKSLAKVSADLINLIKKDSVKLKSYQSMRHINYTQHYIVLAEYPSDVASGTI